MVSQREVTYVLLMQNMERLSLVERSLMQKVKRVTGFAGIDRLVKCKPDIVDPYAAKRAKYILGFQKSMHEILIHINNRSCILNYYADD